MLLLVAIAGVLFAAPGTLTPLFDLAERLGVNDDRLHHASIGAIVAVALAAWQTGIAERPLAPAFAVSSAALGIGGLIESVQPTFDRSPELSDWGFHSLGALIGVFAVLVAAKAAAELLPARVDAAPAAQPTRATRRSASR